MKEKHEIKRVSDMSGKTNVMTIEFDMEDYKRWGQGVLIQNAMPYLTADEREFLMTGITAQEWKEMFGAEE